MTTQNYVSLWNKYRLAILQLMAASAEEPQQYRLYEHEFKDLNPKERKGYTFTLQAFQGKAINNIKSSPVARDLLNILEVSRIACELMNRDTYEFRLDKQFVLHVTRHEAPIS